MDKETSVKDIQDKINSDHPFGLKIWKPALYKKDRSINIKGIKDTRSNPGEMPLSKLVLIPGNLLWLISVGWVLCLLYLIPLIVLYPLKSKVAQEYFRLLLDMAGYVLWPFGKFITRQKVLNEEDVLLLSPQNSPASNRSGKRKEKSLRDRIREEGIVGLIFYSYYYIVLAPVHLIIGGICMIGVFSIPIAKLNFLLVRHCTRHPLELRVYSGFYQQDLEQSGSQSPSAARNRDSVLFWRRSTIEGVEDSSSYPMHEREPIVLCLYKALGWKYYKYTVGGINIIIINLFMLVIFTILDYYWIRNWAVDSRIASHGVIFSCALLSTIPLAYFIGMAVSSITVQTGNIALGSVINATFGSIIEIILYCFAIIEGRVLMVEGAIIGSILCGLLALPGVSMFSGGLMRKEQSFNSKAAGVSTTMLLMSVLGVYSPTIFQMIYGSVEIKCKPCLETSLDSNSCSRCVSVPVHPSKDPIYMSSTRPFM
jgi:Ca2+:H+ antiporter